MPRSNNNKVSLILTVSHIAFTKLSTLVVYFVLEHWEGIYSRWEFIGVNNTVLKNINYWVNLPLL